MPSAESAASTSSTQSTQSAKSVQSTESAEPSDLIEVAEPENAKKGRRVDRGGLAVAAAVLLACGGLMGYGVLNTPDESKARAVKTAEVTYEVTGTGTAEISYLARSESGKATVEKSVALPWKKSVQVPLGKAPTVAVVLGEKGGQASCTLAIRGKHVQLATASGSFGRMTCTGELPAGQSGEGGEN